MGLDSYGAWPGHPRLAVLVAAKTWIAGTSILWGGPQARPEGPARHGRNRFRSVSAYADEPGYDDREETFLLPPPYAERMGSGSSTHGSACFNTSRCGWLPAGTARLPHLVRND